MTNAAVHVEESQHSLQAHVLAPAASHAKGQQHPIKLYLVVWGWLFVLSTCSYLVDYFGIHGNLRWSLICLFMVLKAGLIVAVFMGPPLLVANRQCTWSFPPSSTLLLWVDFHQLFEGGERLRVDGIEAARPVSLAPTRLARLRILRCWEIAGRLIASSPASSPTAGGPPSQGAREWPGGWYQPVRARSG